MAKTWNPIQGKAEGALDLLEGRYAADIGFMVEQSVQSDHVLEAAQALADAKTNKVFASQAGVIVKAQELGLAFQDWGKLTLF